MNIQSVCLVRSAMEVIVDKKQAIFESMLELIREHGFHGAPMSQVAKQAGVAAGTIYYYFESKDQLIQELYDHNRTVLVDIVQATLDREKEATYRAQFCGLWMDLYEFYTQHPRVLVFFEQYHNSPYSADRSPGYARGTFYDFFEEGIRRGQFRAVRPELLIALTISSISAAAKLTVFGKLAVNQADLAQVVDMLWSGLTSPE